MSVARDDERRGVGSSVRVGLELDEDAVGLVLAKACVDLPAVLHEGVVDAGCESQLVSVRHG